MPETRFHLADYIVTAGYFLLMIAIGLYYRRFMQKAKDFFTGDNQVPWWLAGVSYYMTTFSAFAFVAYGEVAYLYGFAGITIMWVSVPGCIVAAYVTAPLWRRARVSTPVEFLEARFSPLFRQLFAWSGFPLRIADNGLRLYSLGVFVSLAVGVDIRWAILSSGLVMLAYTLMGGLWAVAVTDFVQGIVLYAAVLILLPLALWRGNGFSGMLNNLPDGGYLHLVNDPYSLVYILGFSVLIILNYSAGWAMVQRFYSVRDEREARKVGLLAGALHFIGGPLFFLPVMLTRHVLPAVENTRYAYVAMALELLPVGLMGVMVTAMFSATMSTLSAEYNVLAGVATTDIYKRLFRPDADEVRQLRMGRLFTALIGLVIMGIAVWVAYYPETPLFSLMVTIFGVAVAPMMLPLLGGLIFSRLSLRGAVVGFVTGLAAGILTLLVQRFYLPTVAGLDPRWITFQFGAYAIFINVGTALLAMVLWSRFETKSSAEKDRTARFFERMRTPVEAGETTPEGRVPSPFFITGLIVAGIGLLLLGATVLVDGSFGRGLNALTGLILLLTGGLMYRTKPAEPRVGGAPANTTPGP